MIIISPLATEYLNSFLQTRVLDFRLRMLIKSEGQWNPTQPIHCMTMMEMIIPYRPMASAKMSKMIIPTKIPSVWA